MNSTRANVSNPQSFGPCAGLRSSRARSGAVRPDLIILVAIIAAIIGGVLLIKALQTNKRAREAAATGISERSAATSLVKSDASPAPGIAHPSTSSSPAGQSQTAASTNSLSESQRLIAEMWGLCSVRDSITKEEAEKFKHNLEELIHGGSASVPAIREFLAKNADAYFNEIKGGEDLGYSSMRASMIDALKQIGGPEARDAMVEVVKTSAVPAELLEVAKNLEGDAPGEYRDEILKAAREALSMGAGNQLGTNVELGPAFRMLSTYGGENTTADAAQNNPAQFYQALSLANQPGGQGLDSLVQMAQNTSGDASGRTIATEMIAQLAGQGGAALDTFVKMAEGGQIDSAMWARLAPILAGDQYQVNPSGVPGDTSGNQSLGYSVVNNVTSRDQINQRLEMINKFLSMAEPDSGGYNALIQYRDILTSKLGN